MLDTQTPYDTLRTELLVRHNYNIYILVPRKVGLGQNRSESNRRAGWLLRKWKSGILRNHGITDIGREASESVSEMECVAFYF